MGERYGGNICNNFILHLLKSIHNMFYKTTYYGITLQGMEITVKLIIAVSLWKRDDGNKYESYNMKIIIAVANNSSSIMDR